MPRSSETLLVCTCAKHRVMSSFDQVKTLISQTLVRFKIEWNVCENGAELTILSLVINAGLTTATHGNVMLTVEKMKK